MDQSEDDFGALMLAIRSDLPIASSEIKSDRKGLVFEIGKLLDSSSRV